MFYSIGSYVLTISCMEIQIEYILSPQMQKLSLAVYWLEDMLCSSLMSILLSVIDYSIVNNMLVIIQIILQIILTIIVII